MVSLIGEIERPGIYSLSSTTGSDDGLDVGRRRWNSYRPAIFKVISDSIYESQGSQLAKIKDKFIVFVEGRCREVGDWSLRGDTLATLFSDFQDDLGDW